MFQRSTVSILTAALVATVAPPATADPSELPGAARFRQHVRPVLENYCYGCHGYGASEGNRTLDEFASDEAMLADIDLWWAVLKNVRAGLMPPAEELRPTPDERQQLFTWIERDVFGIDPSQPDPGRVTLRRLNRVEYRNTIRDLMGVDYDTQTNFPADDSGYGFDNIGDALSLSPLQMEKYMEAAKEVVGRAVPTRRGVPREEAYPGRRFRGDQRRGDRLSFYQPAEVSATLPIDRAGRYRIVVEASIDGYWEGESGECRVECRLAGQRRFEHRYTWHDHKSLRDQFELDLAEGEHPLEFRIEPLVAADQRNEHLDYRIGQVRVVGPLDESALTQPDGYDRFFPAGPPPDEPAQRNAYARQVLGDFASRAFRRPADEPTVERLAALAQGVYRQPGQSFEQGVAQAMVAVLASPRFLFRVEQLQPADDDVSYPPVDEFALASRLSYFLWSTMPDEQLLDLARRSALRDNLADQVERMLADKRSDALVKNFVGQWLQARDVETISIEPVAALGQQAEWENLYRDFRRNRRKLRQVRRRIDGLKQERDSQPAPPGGDDAQHDPTEEKLADERAQLEAELKQMRQRLREFRQLQDIFNGRVRRAMRRETEMTFEYVIREDRDLAELIDGRYTFLNQTLADYYGIAGVEGRQMRRVELPDDSPRGGLLTQGTLLVVTSNPTRTSPVKRGLFILDNVLGTPAPPPPEPVPALEVAAEAIEGHEPTLREALELHRSEPLCAGCHARMDPLGLALENFNAIGKWRETEHGRPIDTSGRLLTGETFSDVRELKKVLRDDHRDDFYRCLTEKMLTYALGRGLEYYDEWTVEQIVEQIERQDGRFFVLLTGIVESAPFQRQRRPAAADEDRQARREPSTDQRRTAR